ncbi:cell division protein FtsQ [Scopulibacillus daqui]|uniref:Cell division protein DivIB n=1 Tax=Scopulibacillus daqui TaxID=1469162 RepID=A0ABS2PXP5_9BACL|nr:cell division protein FtsQ/DivIB [Scopulibacillus daqui]MBM7644269.1 cell division protein FtsQ [Scopulibacillus daqui]
MTDKKVIPIEDRIPKLKEQRKQKSNRRFIFYIVIFFMLILIVIYLQSPLSTVREIKVMGQHFIDNGKIVKASGLTTKDHYWDIDTRDVEKRIEKLPTVSSAHVKKVFPNKVVINLKEYHRIAYLKKDNKYIPILENGALLTKKNDQHLPVSAPILIGWKNNHQLKEMAKQLSKTPPSIISQISEIYPGAANSGSDSITLYMNDGFKVLASISTFSKKITEYPELVKKIPKNTQGVIHLQVGSYFEPYKQGKKKAKTPDDNHK